MSNEREGLKARACAVIDEHAESIVALGETILRQPETGFREHKTARLVADTLNDIGLQARTGLAITIRAHH